MIEHAGLRANNLSLVDIGPHSNVEHRKDDPQVERVGYEFESYFYSMLIKEMRNTLDEGLFPGDQSDSFGGMFDMHLGQFLAKSQQLGISDLIAESKTL